MTHILYKNSANLLILENAVDWFDRNATGQPTPITSGVTVTGRIYSPEVDSSGKHIGTPLSDPIVMTQEADQVQNYWRGIAPKTVDLSAYDEVSVLYKIDGGSDIAYLEKWADCKVVDE